MGSSTDVGAVLERARNTPGVLGFAVVAGSVFGCVGDLEIVPLKSTDKAPEACAVAGVEVCHG